jgi:hypothetical protein
MVLDSKLSKKITDFVYSKPRTVQEIAHCITKNWRTADRYVDKIAEETGVLSARTFREGTRGALKIVFWNNIEKIHSSQYQERLFKQIEFGRKKEDFSPLDIYQYVADSKKEILISDSDEKGKLLEDFKEKIGSAEKQVLFFSGNLSWMNLAGSAKLIESLIKRKVSMKVLARIDITTVESANELLAMNEAAGYDAIELRHCFQPLRGFIIDKRLASLKEVKDPKEVREFELKKKTFLFYRIYEDEWIEWLQKVFWNLFRTSLPAKERIKCLSEHKV